MSKKYKKGFTLIELLVVIAIIGILSSVVLLSLQSGRDKALDKRRIQDLNQIRTALFMYYDTYGNWMQTGSGCGSAGVGSGWFNYQYPGFTAMSQCLVNAGLTPQEIIDPSKARTGSTPTNNINVYMKYSCSSGTYLLAKLTTVPQSATATDNACCAACDTTYGMNYVLKVN